MVELLAFTVMCPGRRDLRTMATVVAVGGLRASLTQVWSGFDVLQCECYDANDRAVILAAISQSSGGITGFTQDVRQLLAALANDVQPRGLIAFTRRIFRVSRPAPRTVAPHAARHIATAKYHRRRSR